MSLQSTIATAVNTAFATIGDLRCSVTLVRQVMGAFDSDTRSYSQTEENYSFDGVVEFVSSDSEQGATAVVAKVYLKPETAEPKEGDVCIVNSVRYRVNKVKSIVPNGIDVLLWELEVTL